MDIIRSGGVVIHDSFPAVPGDYRLTVFLRNPLSKEFTHFRKRGQHPGRGQAAPGLAPDRVQGRRPGQQFLLRLQGRRPPPGGRSRPGLSPPPRCRCCGWAPYNLDRSLWEKGRFEWEIRGLNERRPFRQENERPLAAFPYQRNLNAMEKISPAPLPPDFYSVTLKLVDGRRRHPRQPRDEFPGLAAAFPAPAERNVQPGHGRQPVLFRLPDRPAVPRPRRPGKGRLRL